MYKDISNKLTMTNVFKAEETKKPAKKVSKKAKSPAKSAKGKKTKKK